jgi:transcriptional regulator with XRE-family HTH domain
VRVARGKTQTQVAEAAGLFQSRVSEIERDAYSPGLELAESLARGLDAPLSDLIAVCEGRLSVEKVAVIGGPLAPRAERGDRTRSIEMGSVARRLALEVVKATEELLSAGGPEPAKQPSTKRPVEPTPAATSKRSRRR